MNDLFKPHQCPRCFGLFKVGDRFWNDSGTVYHWLCWVNKSKEAAYLAGWNASGEGYNAEYPFGDHARNPEEDAAWIKDRDNALREALAQPQQEPVPAAIKTVIEAMQVDPEYAWSWHCNIAMAFVDAGGDHYTGNQGAARFMKMLANVEPAHELPSPPAQPQQEPVAWANPNDLQNFDLKVRTNAGPLHTVPLYTSPPAQPQQEPVVWAISYDGKTPYTIWPDGDGALLDLEVKRQGGTTCKLPLYTSPPAQRKPLTDEEISAIGSKIFPSTWNIRHVEFARAIEAAHGIKGDA